MTEMQNSKRISHEGTKRKLATEDTEDTEGFLDADLHGLTQILFGREKTLVLRSEYFAE